MMIFEMLFRWHTLGHMMAVIHSKGLLYTTAQMVEISIYDDDDMVKSRALVVVSGKVLECN